MKPTTVSLQSLAFGSVPFTTLEEAFGSSSLGILVVKNLPAKYNVLREKLLSYSSYLAHLPEGELDAITNAAAHFEIGWSHGKEALKSGQYDTMKGSYYADCQSFYLENPSIPELEPGKASIATRGAATNLWPPETLMPGFRTTFEELCTLLIDIGALVARAVDLYASEKILGYQAGYLERVVRMSHTPKARLLHYFPKSGPDVSSSATSSSSEKSETDEDDWCATHLDDGCLTALTSALYIDESAPLPPLTSTSPFHPSPPSPRHSTPEQACTSTRETPRS